MGFLIDTVRIAGFRGIKNFEISMTSVTVLIGVNNSGKTSVLKALQLALGDYAHSLTEEDFYISVDEKRAKEILVDIRIVPSDNEGRRVCLFDDAWASVFGDIIRSEPNGNQYCALRVSSSQDLIKGGFETTRETLAYWPAMAAWNTEKIKKTKMLSRLRNVPFIAIEAQRDIHQELREKYSFIGKVLSDIEYDQAEIIKIEQLLKNINDEAIKDSVELAKLKESLESLHRSFQGSGSVEVTPFPKKVRDISKQYSIHFGETKDSIFSMEYHGMGTRSWASILTVKTFLDLLAEKHKEEVEPFFPIITVEEPEAHLHPNAQKTIYRQLQEFNGQVIISTHSPYFSAIAEITQLRCLKKENGLVTAKYIDNMDGEECRRLRREIIHTRGELLYSKALVLCEGETEEQALPLLFEKYFTEEAFALGINFIGVRGAGNYSPFLKFAKSFSIPVFIFSDGEDKVVRQLEKQYKSVFGELDFENCNNITILQGTDFEGYLINSGFLEIIKSAIDELNEPGYIEKWISENNGKYSHRSKTENPPCTACNQHIYKDVYHDYGKDYHKALRDILGKSKPKYAPVIANKLCQLDSKKFPPKIIDHFEQVRAAM